MLPRLARRLLVVLAVGGLLTAAAGAASAAPVRSAAGMQVSTITTGLQVPWDIAFMPDGRALVTERPGRVRIVGADGRLAPTPAATLAVSASGEGGLLGVAVDPQFAAGAPFVYLYLTTGGQVQVQRHRFAGDRLTLDGVVVSGIPAGDVHTSGRVRFGPDGALYLGTGDTGDGDLAQSPSSLAGKILRLPPGAHRNPAPVMPQVVAIGLRHPQGMAWQPGGPLFVTDHGASGFDGPSGDDELDAITPGGNYGWPLVRGANHGPYAAPAALWTQTIAPAGLAFVTQGGSTWTGNALVTGLAGQQLRRLTLSGTRVIADEPLLVRAHGRLRAIAEAPDGSIWVGTSNRDGRGSPRSGDDRLLRIVPPAGGPPAGAPAPTPTRPRRTICVPDPRARAARGLARTVLERRLLKSQRVAQRALRSIRTVEARAQGAPLRGVRCRTTPDPVRFSARQLLISQRITQAVIHRTAVVRARLADRPPPAAPRRTLTVKDIVAGPRQMRINERIAIAALKRVRALDARISGGELA
ncbi:PQQ-dependent sugar dehydrogenase [Miltoncostaea marina]|uniref:PQQ-dependent sugar dehydrogenase n=1 Tax=Miltoncostaea marina TaxID=2843215 RepID=UPI001FE6EB62|nr:PQQ-dependent sugar dehydrogenase [Miltoncostaea marina]